MRRKSGEDAITLKAAALAFVTILALIPLLAAFSFVGTQLLHRYQERILDVLTSFLPYSESDLVETIEKFVHQAENLQETGALIFVLVGLGAFMTIEETINKIWRVSTRRTLRAKLLSFTLLVFWGPMVIGSGLALLAVLRSRPGFDVLFQESILVRALPFLVSAVGLTMLYWQVPYTQVRFRAAAAGGVLAALLLELLRHTFGLYVSSLTEISRLVYGGFALALFFMVSVQLAWWAVLIGCEVAFVTQHADSLTRSRQLDARWREPWVGLAATLLLGQELRSGRPLQDLDTVSSRLGLAPEALEEALEPLRRAGVVVETGGDARQYLLARPPQDVAVETVLAAYDGGLEELGEALPADLGARLSGVSTALQQSRRRTLADRTLADLLPSATPAVDGPQPVVATGASRTR
ncbi:MAG TPA: YhjD/YihY/BrkB family envelope integrity protein [Thermoanaerobaculia bacterium]|nr:YhjD/YihY/BrkB family envelope integrity protein [Thermoanaerobaculia bacterium]